MNWVERIGYTWREGDCTKVFGAPLSAELAGGFEDAQLTLAHFLKSSENLRNEWPELLDRVPESGEHHDAYLPERQILLVLQVLISSDERRESCVLGAS